MNYAAFSGKFGTCPARPGSNPTVPSYFLVKPATRAVLTRFKWNIEWVDDVCAYSYVTMCNQT